MISSFTIAKTGLILNLGIYFLISSDFNFQQRIGDSWNLDSGIQRHKYSSKFMKQIFKATDIE